MQYVNEMLIRSSVSEVWDALTNPKKTKEYYYGFEINTDLKKDSKYTYSAGGFVGLEGVIKEIISGSKLVMTFNAKWDPELAKAKESLVTWELEQRGENTFVRMTHDGLLLKGWVDILSSLKSYIETGKPLKIQTNQ